MASLKERQGRRRIAIRLARAIRGAENSYILALRRAVGAAHARYQAAALKIHASEKAGGLTRQDAEWNEEEHPRDEKGRFAGGVAGLARLPADHPFVENERKAGRYSDFIDVSSVFSKPPVQALFGTKQSDLKKVRVVEIAVDKLEPTQDFIPAAGLEAYMQPDAKDPTGATLQPPLVIRYQGRYFLQDHTRTAAQIVNGATRVKARLLDLDVHNGRASYSKPPADERHDSLSFLDEDFDEIDEEVAAELASQVSAAYDRMAARLSAANKVALIEQGVAIDLRKDKHLALKMAAARDANIQLVEKARREYAESVREIFDDPDVYGKTPKELTELLMERGDVWKSRASLIARDQTLKLNSAITKERHQNAGITEYIWSTSQDSRVRPEHADLEGTQHSWDVPPEPGHPGEDFQCRCCAIPIFPVTDDGKEDQEEEGEED